MAQLSLDAIYGPAGAARTPIDRPPPSRFAFVASRESWITLGLLMLLQFPVVTSLETTRWVKEMPSLLLASSVGLVSGWLLASTRGRTAWLHAIGITFGLTVALAELLHSMRLADPLVSSGLRARWTELWLRMGDWVEVAVSGTSSADPLPFVLLLVLLVWALAYVSAWAVIRSQNAWLAIVPAGFVLLTNISYLPGQPSLSFVAFLFGGVLLVARMHFLRELRRWRVERAAIPDFLSFEVLFAGVWIALILIVSAWLIPTANDWGPVAERWRSATSPVTGRIDKVGRLFVGIGSKKPLAAHAFGDLFPLRGQLALSDTVLMEVSAPGPVNIRGAVYDEYTGTGWRVSSASTVPLLGTSMSAAEFGTPETRSQVRLAVPIEVTVTGDLPDRRLLSAGEPLAASVEADGLVGASFGDLIGLVPADRLRVGGVYSTVGTISAAAEPTLLESGRDYPADIVERYTAVPDDLPPEIGALARDIAGGAQPPYEVARRVEQYLRANYVYALDVEDPPPLHDTVDYFLFDSRRGYFDYFASAMALLLRTTGIPTRIVTGFVLDDEDLSAVSKAYEVPDRRAWAWPEVYFAGLGWVEFNPTPTRPSASRPLDDSALLASAGARGADSFAPFDELLEDEFFDTSQTIGRGSLGVDAPSRGVGQMVVLVVEAAVALAAAAVVFALGARLAWEWGFRGLTPPVKRWAKVQRLASWAGIHTWNTLTPLEATREIAPVVNERGPLERLARAFTTERYGAAATVESEEQGAARDQDYRDVQRKLWPFAIRRALRLRRFSSAPAPSTLRGTPAARR